MEVCKTDVHRYCEKFSNIFPFPVEEQNCHFEPKKICEMAMKTCPKKAKKYSYTKDCNELPREICARRRKSCHCATSRRDRAAPTSPRRLVTTWISSTATKSRRWCSKKFVI